MTAELAAALSGIAYLLVPNAHFAIVLLAPPVFFHAVPYGVGSAALMQVTQTQMRGQISAVYLFTINLIGLGVGPTAVALVADHVFRNDNMVGASLLMVGTTASILAALILWRGLKSYVRSQGHLREWIEALAV
jgi:hypothetical protein